MLNKKTIKIGIFVIILIILSLSIFAGSEQSHPAEQIVSGIFSGNFNFNGSFLSNNRAVELNTLQTQPANNTINWPGIGGSGLYTSITNGADGFPIISYYNAWYGDLQITKCNNLDCSSFINITIDSTGDVGKWTSIILGADGNPIISYYDVTNRAVKIAKCGDSSCSSGNTITTLDSGGVGNEKGLLGTSIMIGQNGNPLVVYSNSSSGGLNLKVCSNPSCSSSTTQSLSSDGKHPSITPNINGYPIISYVRTGANIGDAALRRCTSWDCATHTRIDVETVGTYNLTSITTGSGGPSVVYQKPGGNGLYYAYCTSSTCSVINKRSLSGSAGYWPSITYNPSDGSIMVSHYDKSNDYLDLVYCPDHTSCAAAITLYLDQVTSLNAEGYTSITRGTDGNYIIAYNYDDGWGSYYLKTFKCANSMCLPYWTRR